MGSPDKKKELKVPATRPEPETPSDWGADINALLSEIAEKFPGIERKDAMLVGEPALVTSSGNVVDLAHYLRDNDIRGFKYCRCVTGTDKVDRYEVVYNLASLPKPGEASDTDFRRIAIVVQIIDREKPSTPTLQEVWPGAGFQEREVFDMLGIRFKKHNDLRRILLSEEFRGYPLRKDYPLHGKWEDMQAIGAYLDEQQVKIMKEEAGLDFNPEDVQPNFKR